MEVTDDFLQTYVNGIDAMIIATRNMLIWKKIATSLLGVDSQRMFDQASADLNFLGEEEIALANLREMRRAGVDMLDRLRRGEPVQPPIARIN